MSPAFYRQIRYANSACLEPKEGGRSPQDTNKKICKSKKPILQVNFYICDLTVTWYSFELWHWAYVAECKVFMKPFNFNSRLIIN